MWHKNYQGHRTILYCHVAVYNLLVLSEFSQFLHVLMFTFTRHLVFTCLLKIITVDVVGYIGQIAFHGLQDGFQPVVKMVT